MIKFNEFNEAVIPCLIVSVEEDPGFTSNFCAFRPANSSTELLGRIRMFKPYMHEGVGKTLDCVVTCDFTELFVPKTEKKSASCTNYGYLDAIGQVLSTKNENIILDVSFPVNVESPGMNGQLPSVGEWLRVRGELTIEWSLPKDTLRNLQPTSVS